MGVTDRTGTSELHVHVVLTPAYSCYIAFFSLNPRLWPHEEFPFVSSQRRVKSESSILWLCSKYWYPKAVYSVATQG